MGNCIVVDDNQTIIGVFCELLDIIGFDVLATGVNGMDAVKLYEKYHPDLIFVDMRMPKYDGFFAIRNIRNQAPYSKIVVTSGEITTDDCHLLEDPLKILFGLR